MEMHKCVFVNTWIQAILWSLLTEVLPPPKYIYFTLDVGQDFFYSLKLLSLMNFIIGLLYEEVTFEQHNIFQQVL